MLTYLNWRKKILVNLELSVLNLMIKFVFFHPKLIEKEGNIKFILHVQMRKNVYIIIYLAALQTASDRSSGLHKSHI